MIDQGCDALILADRLGHEKVSTTLNTYSHLFPHKQQELVSNLEQLAATVGVTPTPEPPMGNPLLDTMGISYDCNMESDSVTPDTVICQYRTSIWSYAKRNSIRKSNPDASKKSYLKTKRCEIE